MKLRLRLVLNISGSGLQSIEPKHRQILQIDLSSERTMLVAERFIACLINKFGKCPVSTDG
jgi:transposase-like protein